MSEFEEEARKEIVKLHVFFEGWFNGELEDAAFQIVERALATGFRLISPRGTVDRRDELLDGLRRAKGSRAGEMRIWIEQCEIVCVTDELMVASYQEWQQVALAPPSGRCSTVVFRRDQAGLRWQHVHETWLPP